MTVQQKLHRDRRDANIIAGAVLIITALDDYEATYPSATGAKARRNIYDMLVACGVKMSALQDRKESVARAIVEMTCQAGKRELREMRADIDRLRGKRRALNAHSNVTSKKQEVT